MNKKEMLRERQLLEDKIQDLVLKFEDKTGLTVSHIEVRHEQNIMGQHPLPWIVVDASLEG